MPTMSRMPVVLIERPTRAVDDRPSAAAARKTWLSLRLTLTVADPVPTCRPSAYSSACGSLASSVTCCIGGTNSEQPGSAGPAARIAASNPTPAAVRRRRGGAGTISEAD